LLLGGLPSLAWGLTPDSPEVKALVKKGLDFLEKGAPSSGQLITAPDLERLGEKVLVGLAFFKSGKPDHKLVKEAIQAVQTEGDWPAEDNYSLGLSVILLAELEAEAKNKQHLPLIQKLVDEILARQLQNGSWGYARTGSLGDTSQIQYAVLGCWNAQKVGAKVPKENIERAIDFLLRIQDPGGGFSYNGNDPGNYNRTAQAGVTHSLTAAGLGSICVCADLLGIHQRRAGEEADEESGLPSALLVVKKPKGAVQEVVADTRIEAAVVDREIKDGENWFKQNYKIDTGMLWNYYYLYGLERCESYREHYYSLKFVKEPKWYNDGVAFLAKKNQGGGWMGDHSAKASTSFAILFLQRSAYKAITTHTPDLGDGVLTSGKGLPTDLAAATVKRGKLVDSSLAAEVDAVSILLDDPDNPELAGILDNNEEFKLDPDSTKRSNQIVKLRNLVSAGNWEARMLAVRGLGKVRDLDNVPSLLYALTDPDERVVLEADSALRFISRKLHGVGMPAEPNDDKKGAQTARKAWRDWYLSIRPDAELID
jgi:hypothetical protein